MEKLVFVFIFLLVAATMVFAQCPSITMIGPAGVTAPGDQMIFRVVPGAVGSKLEYSWTVSSGTIVEGQGTPTITLATDRSMAGWNLTATVQFEHPVSGCKGTSSGSALIAPLAIGEPVDQWPSSLRLNDQRGRLDAFFHVLAMNPDQIGLMVLVVPKAEALDAKNPGIQFVIRHAKLKKFDKSRLWFALESGGRKKVTVWTMTPGADVPCHKCKIIKGGDL